MLPGASAARTRRHSPSAVSSDVFRRGSCRSDHTPDRQVRSVVKRTGAAMPAALFPVLPLPEKAAGMGYCRHEKDLPALRLYDRNHFSRLRRGSEAGRNALDSKSSYRLIAGTWVRIPPSPPFIFKLLIYNTLYLMEPHCTLGYVSGIQVRLLYVFSSQSTAGLSPTYRL